MIPLTCIHAYTSLFLSPPFSCCTVTDLEVLDSCQFTSKLAYAHKLKKQYEGVYQVCSHIFSVHVVVDVSLPLGKRESGLSSRPDCVQQLVQEGQRQ